jgi:SAM-dependent methyltransferase
MAFDESTRSAPMWRIFLRYVKPRLARKLKIEVSDAEELGIILQAIDHKIESRSHYPDHGKERFLLELPRNASILDVGCGNNSPKITKETCPDCHYVGLDIGDYNQEHPHFADEYIITTPASFALAIANLGPRFDAVISSHNLEHCDDRAAVLSSMLSVLKPGGMLYLSFPSRDSLDFPSRIGSLNYRDDGTHKDAPPDFAATVAAVFGAGCEVMYATSRYQPPLRWLIGLYHEARSRSSGRVDTETWAYWGFESVIWARKPC